jgi:hypothetical protein
MIDDRRHLLLSLSVLLRRRCGNIARYRGEVLAPRGGMRATGRVIRLERSRDVVDVDRGRVGRNVEERRRAAALRRAERGSGHCATRLSVGQFLLLFVRGSVRAGIAHAVLVLVLVLASHVKGEPRRLANDPPRRASRVARACCPLLAMLSQGCRRCPVRIL